MKSSVYKILDGIIHLILFLLISWLFVIFSNILQYLLNTSNIKDQKSNAIIWYMVYLFLSGCVGCWIKNRRYLKFPVNSLANIAFQKRMLIGESLALIGIAIFMISARGSTFIWNIFVNLGNLLKIWNTEYERVFYASILDFTMLEYIIVTGLGFSVIKILFDKRIVKN